MKTKDDFSFLQAMHRRYPAAPTRWLCGRLLIWGNVLHHGRGKDILSTQLIKSCKNVAGATEYDINVAGIDNPAAMERKYDTIISNYTLNCLPPTERTKVIAQVYDATGKVAFFSVRKKTNQTKRLSTRWKRYKDGVSNGKLFQKYYSPEELERELGRCFDITAIIRNHSDHIIGAGYRVKLPRRSITYGTGKVMGNNTYIHWTNANAIRGYERARRMVPLGFEYQVVKHNSKTGNFSFIMADEFDLEREPTVGNSFLVRPSGEIRATRRARDPWIYHHKWLFVDDDYFGFDVNKEKGRSAAWMALPGIDKSRIGKKSFWMANVAPLIRHT